MSLDCAGRHVCDHPRWPTSATDSHACDECGRVFTAFRVIDHTARLRIPDHVVIPVDSYGWTSEPMDADPRP